MKICKNCGFSAEDTQLRCPKCGDLFDEDMDSMLRAMKNNLNAYKEEVRSAPAPQPSPAAPVQAAPNGYDLQSELAQVKGELRALRGEVDRVAVARGGYQQAQVPVLVQPVAASAAGVQQPTVLYQTVPQVVAAPAVSMQGAAQYQPATARIASPGRSANRIVLSVFAFLLLALSAAMFFFDWVEGAFSGADAVAALFGSDRGLGLELYIASFITKDSFLFDWLATACAYILRYGVLVYAVLLVLGLPLLLSFGGKIKCKGWHVFCAWSSLLVMALLFAVLCVASGLSSVSLYLYICLGANVLRCLLLLFYRGKAYERRALHAA